MRIVKLSTHLGGRLSLPNGRLSGLWSKLLCLTGRHVEGCLHVRCPITVLRPIVQTGTLMCEARWLFWALYFLRQSQPNVYCPNVQEWESSNYEEGRGNRALRKVIANFPDHSLSGFAVSMQCSMTTSFSSFLPSSHALTFLPTPFPSLPKYTRRVNMS